MSCQKNGFLLFFLGLAFSIFTFAQDQNLNPNRQVEPVQWSFDGSARSRWDGVFSHSSQKLGLFQLHQGFSWYASQSVTGRIRLGISRELGTQTVTQGPRLVFDSSGLGLWEAQVRWVPTYKLEIVAGRQFLKIGNQKVLSNHLNSNFGPYFFDGLMSYYDTDFAQLGAGHFLTEQWNDGGFQTYGSSMSLVFIDFKYLRDIFDFIELYAVWENEDATSGASSTPSVRDEESNFYYGASLAGFYQNYGFAFDLGFLSGENKTQGYNLKSNFVDANVSGIWGVHQVIGAKLFGHYSSGDKASTGVNEAYEFLYPDQDFTNGIRNWFLYGNLVSLGVEAEYTWDQSKKVFAEIGYLGRSNKSSGVKAKTLSGESSWVQADAITNLNLSQARDLGWVSSLGMSLFSKIDGWDLQLVGSYLNSGSYLRSYGARRSNWMLRFQGVIDWSL